MANLFSCNGNSFYSVYVEEKNRISDCEYDYTILKATRTFFRIYALPKFSSSAMKILAINEFEAKMKTIMFS